MDKVIRPADNIYWARPVERPSFIPVSRPKGAKAAGLRYERAFAAYLKPMGCVAGQWFEFEDRTGVRYCQTDIIFPLNRRLFALIEVKYTLVDRAYDQLLDLYGPVVEAAYNTRVGLVTVFRNTRGEFDRTGLCDDIRLACQWSIDTGGVGLLRWMGQPVVHEPNEPNERLKGVIKEA